MPVIYLDIASPANVRAQSQLTTAFALEHATTKWEVKLVRGHGFARPQWELSRALGCACAFALLAVALGLGQIGGAL